MKLKHGVSVAGASIEIQIARAIAREVWRDYGHELVITGGTEDPANHMENSKHAYGDADDYRVRYFTPEEQKAVKKDMQRRLPVVGDYTVILHEGHHMHVQYNRR